MRICMGNVYLCSHKIKNKYIILKNSINFISDTRIKLNFRKLKSKLYSLLSEIVKN